MDHALDAETRATSEPLLQRLGAHLKGRYGDDVFVRIAPAIEPWRPALILEAYAPNTSAAALEVELDSQHAYLTIGNGIGCALFEHHDVNGEVADWLVSRITAACDLGIELWVDRRRHLFGGQNVAKIVGETFTQLTAKHASRLSLATTTEPWSAKGAHLIPDPIGDPGSTAYFVDDRLPESLRLIANEMRVRFGTAISIVSAKDPVERTVIEILPQNELAARVRVHETSAGQVGISAGQNQYPEYEYDTLPFEDAVTWLNEVGTHGLLETVRGRTVYYFVNHAATPENIRAVEADRKVTFSEISPPWE